MIRFIPGTVAALLMLGTDGATAQSCESPPADTRLSAEQEAAVRYRPETSRRNANWRERLAPRLQSVRDAVERDVQDAAFEDSGAGFAASAEFGLDAHESDLGQTDSYLYDAAVRAGDVRAEAVSEAGGLMREAEVLRRSEETYSGTWSRDEYRHPEETYTGTAAAGDFRRQKPREYGRGHSGLDSCGRPISQYTEVAC